MKIPVAFIFGFMLLVPALVVADNSDETLEFYLGKSDLVVLGKITNEPFGIIHETGVPNYICEFKVDDVLKGDGALAATTIRVNIVRIEMDAKDQHPLVKNDSACILFLKKQPAGNQPVWVTADIWFGIQQPSPTMAGSLKRISNEMTERARRKPLRQLERAKSAENRRALMELADGADQDVAIEALSRLSGYDSTPELIAFLNRKMKDAKPRVSLAAAIITCYSGDWSGFDMLLQHVKHNDQVLRKEAIGQLVDIRFRNYSKQVAPLLLDRLRLAGC